VLGRIRAWNSAELVAVISTDEGSEISVRDGSRSGMGWVEVQDAQDMLLLQAQVH
jgi:hypothetical protein